MLDAGCGKRAFRTRRALGADGVLRDVLNEDKSVFPVVGNTHFHFQLSISVDAGANFLQ